MLKIVFKKLVFSLLVFAYLFLVVFSKINRIDAQEINKFGIHILNIHELQDAKKMFFDAGSLNSWHYITVPFTLADLEKANQWQDFFNLAKEARIIPLVRLTTSFEDGAWKIPTRKEVVSMINFLAKLNWPSEQKHIIIFNEVNHAKEWGGKIDPLSYTIIFRFASSWAKATDRNFVILPSAMDLAANNSVKTMDAFTYLEQMLAIDPEIFYYADVWNSHAYPNPGFSSSPERTGRNSLRGFMHELAFIKERTGRDMSVMITETGWQMNANISRWLDRYYLYAVEHIWSDDRVLAVTPFLLRGSPGPFAGFSMLDESNNTTKNYWAYVRAVGNQQLLVQTN